MADSAEVDGEQWPLGQRLRDARTALRLSQKAAAQRADVSNTLWQQLESGRRADGKPVNPKARTILDAAGAVDIDPGEALQLAGLDPTVHQPSRRPGRRNVSESEMMELFAGLTTRQRAALVELVDSLHDPAGRQGPPHVPPFGETEVYWDSAPSTAESANRRGD